jgi:hypothetical protein
MTRRIRFITIVGAALVLTAPAFGQGQPAESVWEDALVAKSNGTYLHYRGAEQTQRAVAPTSVWEQALIARSQGLNARYGLGQHSPALKALQYRSEALNRQYGLGEFARVVPPARLTESIVSREQTARAMLQAERRYGMFRDAGLTDLSTPAELRGAALRDVTHAPDAFERTVISSTREASPVPVETTSGSEVDWPQIGLGAGFGLLLGLGLVVAIRFVRIRPLAH